MQYISKKIVQDISEKTEKVSEVTIFKYQYFLNNKNCPLAVLRQEVHGSLLPNLKII
jgi:hypothetical protein